MVDLAERLSTRRRELDYKINQTLVDGDLSASAKERITREIYREARDAYNAEIEGERDRLLDNLRKARVEAFGPQNKGLGPANNPALWLAYRESIREANELDTQEDLSAAVEDALEIGDRLKALALLRRSLEVGATGPAESVMASIPEFRDAVDRFSEANQAYGDFLVEQGVLAVSLRKPEDYSQGKQVEEVRV